MFNILNLDPLEFEKFCMDFMEKKLNTKFKRFGPGKDDGIDLISLDGKIICQCKRYKDSSNLKTVCQNEYNKIKNTEFEKYYLLTTAELGKKIVENIYEIFHEYMDDYSYIIGKTDIDDFLSDTNNIDVLKKNHKLWLSSSIVLDLYLNRYSDAISKVIINDFENETKFFVETKAYYNAVDIINSNGIILFVGDPGIGKTITSKMLIRYLLANNKDYKLTTVSNNDLSKLIESVHQNDDPEIIFLDDFLGQTSLSLDDKLINDLKNLLKLTTIFNNKKVILNSRITILNKAKHEKEEFEKLLDEIGIKECLIDVNDLSQLDRARILYNLMYHNGVTKKSFNTIKKDNNYNLIINHKSFNTRIIEMCCKRSNRVASENFLNYIIESLNNPKDIWKSEFERIETCDVVLMYQLYTLGNNYIPVDCLHKSVTNYLCNSNSEVEKYSFEDSINRLSKSLIGIAILGKKKYISVLNPSINDYIQNYLLDNMAELKKIYDNALYIEQIDKIVNILPSILEDKIEGFEKLIAYNQYNSFMSNQYLDKKKKINFILKNKYFDMLTMIYLLFYLMGGVSLGAAIYYFTYNCGNAGLFGKMISIFSVANVIGLIAAPMLVKKLKNIRILNVGCFILNVIVRAIYLIFVMQGNAPVVVWMYGLVSLTCCTLGGTFNALVSEASEYTYLKTGKRMDGSMYSCTSFGMKVGNGLGSAISGWLLAASHYDATAAVQSASCTNMLSFMFAGIPLIITVIILILYYKLDVEKVNQKLRSEN